MKEKRDRNQVAVDKFMIPSTVKSIPCPGLQEILSCVQAWGLTSTFSFKDLIFSSLVSHIFFSLLRSELSWKMIYFYILTLTPLPTFGK